MNRSALTPLLLLTLLVPDVALSADKWVAQVKWENDFWGGSDVHYTNGMELGVETRDLKKCPKPIAPLVAWHDRISRIFTDKASTNADAPNCRFAFRVGQLIFTPEDIEIRELIEDDRPYAGWLYLGVDLVVAAIDDLQILSLNLGVVGPESQAEAVQKGIHELLDQRKPQGWNNQLKFEPGAILGYSGRKRIWHLKPHRIRYLDVIPDLRVDLGNIRTSFDFGGRIRAGWNVPDDFGPDTILPPPLSASKGGWYDLNAYALAGFSSRLVLHNIFLDGNTSKDSHRVDKEYFVADFEVGVAVAYKSVVFSYIYVWKSPEFKERRRWHNYGSLRVGVRF